jgi:hypothetical protein
VVGDILQVLQQEQTQTEEHIRIIALETESNTEETRNNNQNIENIETTERTSFSEGTKKIFEKINCLQERTN